MAKLKSNGILQEIRGTLGIFTIKDTPRGPIVTQRPEIPRRWSAKQVAQRARMTEARRFYRDEMTDPIRAAHYRARAKERALPISSFVMGGYLKHGAGFRDLEAPTATPGGQADGRDGADCE
jgi:hypothetical protein